MPLLIPRSPGVGMLLFPAAPGTAGLLPMTLLPSWHVSSPRLPR